MKTAVQAGDRTTQPLELTAGDRILLIQLRAMGDMLLTTPLIRALKQKYPQVVIDVLAEHLPAQTLSNNPYLNQVQVSPSRGSGLLSYVGLIKRLRRERYNFAIDLISTPGSALLTRLTNAKVRIGYDLKWRAWAYTQPIKRRVEPIYNPLTKFDLVKSLKVELNGTELDIFPSTGDNQSAMEFEDQLTSEDSTFIALAPWSKRAWRRWPLSHWLDIMTQLARTTDVTWLLLGTQHERDELSELMDCEDIDVQWVGAESISQVAAVMKRCSLYLGADNGLKHVAVAVDLPTVTVYTGSDPRVWNPPDDSRHTAIVVSDDDNSTPETMQKLTDIISSILTT